MRPLGQILNLFPKAPMAVWKWELNERCPFYDCLIRPSVSDNGRTRWVIDTHLGEEYLFEGAYIVRKGPRAYFVLNESQLQEEYAVISKPIPNSSIYKGDAAACA